MPEPVSATIIAFPRAKAPAPDAGPHAQLERALAALDAALAEQRAAVAQWRQSLGELHGSVQGLGQSLGTFQSRLGTLAEDVDGLNREARRMEAWADGVLAADGAAGPA